MKQDMIDYSGLPEHMQDGFRRYIEQRIALGSFGEAVVSNDLREACGRADDVNRYLLFEIVRWLYNHAPSQCAGSPQKVEAWLDAQERAA